MKKILSLLLIIGTVVLSGCGDKEARVYAEKMIVVLDSYQEQLTQKIKAEQASYKELADIYEKDRKMDISIRLANERQTRAENLGEKTANADQPPTLTEIFASLQEYGKLDFETTQSLLQEELDARGKYLTDLESIEIELQKIKVLKEALQDLSKSKGKFKNLKDAVEFVQKIDEEFNNLKNKED